MNPTILLIEDDENDVFFMQRAFEKSVPSCFQLHVVRDGREALQYLFGEGEFSDRERFPVPCLTLLDLNIPYVPGMGVLKRLREDAELQRLIVVVLTSSALESDMEEAYTLGANSYLTKPTEVDERLELAELLSKYWLRKNRLPTALAAQCAQ